MKQGEGQPFAEIINLLDYVQNQIKEIIASPAFNELVAETKKAAAALFDIKRAARELWPLINAEMQARGVTFEQMQATKDTPETEALAEEIMQAAKAKLKAYRQARAFLASRDNIKDWLENPEVEGNVNALKSFEYSLRDFIGGRLDKRELLLQKIIKEWFNLDWMKDPQEAAENWGRDNEGNKIMFDAALNQYYYMIAKAVAEKTGSNTQQVLNPQEATEEQTDMFLAFAARKQIERMKAFLNTRYVKATEALGIMKMNEEKREIAKLASIYFFATRPGDDVKGIKAGKLDAQETQEVEEIQEKMLLYSKKNPLKPGGAVDFLSGFIKQEIPEGKARDTAIIKAETSSLDSGGIPLDIRLGDKTYPLILQNSAINAYSFTSSRTIKGDSFSEKGQTTFQGVTIAQDYYKNLPLDVKSKQILDALLLKLTINYYPHGGEEIKEESIDRRREVELTLAEYMNLRGLRDKKEARAQLNNGLKAIYNSSLEFDEKRYEKGKRGKVKTHWVVRIIDSMGQEWERNPVKDGKSKVKFTYDIAKYFTHSQYMPYHKGLFKINPKKNPHSYYMGKKLLLHHNINIIKDNTSRISVKALLECCPDMPKYEEVMAAGQHLTQRIIEPFDRDMLALKKEGILKDWRYCNSKGEPLTRKQVDAYNYDTWIQWLVEFELKEYPPEREEQARKKLEANRKKFSKRKGGNGAVKGG